VSETIPLVVLTPVLQGVRKQKNKVTTLLGVTDSYGVSYATYGMSYATPEGWQPEIGALEWRPGDQHKWVLELPWLLLVPDFECWWLWFKMFGDIFVSLVQQQLFEELLMVINKNLLGWFAGIPQLRWQISTENN
jgi:hypothetical protein